MIGLPPVLVGALHEMVALASPGVAVTFKGACGGKVIRETLALALLATHTLDPSGLTATPYGYAPTVIGVTVLSDVAMRKTVPSPMLVTHTLDPSGLTATPKGFAPTAIEVTALLEVSIRETLALALLSTHTLDPSGLTATPKGFAPTGIEVTAVVEGVVALASPDKAMTPRMENAVARTRVLRKNRILSEQLLVIISMPFKGRDQ